MRAAISDMSARRDHPEADEGWEHLSVKPIEEGADERPNADAARRTVDRRRLSSTPVATREEPPPWRDQTEHAVDTRAQQGRGGDGALRIADDGPHAAYPGSPFDRALLPLL